LKELWDKIDKISIKPKYSLFVKQNYQSYKEKHESLKKNQVMEIMKERWALMSEEEKIPFIVIEDKKPRKLTSYNIYYKEQYKSIKNNNNQLKLSEISKIIASQWKQMTDEEKKKYKVSEESTHVSAVESRAESAAERAVESAAESTAVRPVESAAESTHVSAVESRAESAAVRPVESAAERAAVDSTAVRPIERAAESTHVSAVESAAESTAVRPVESAAERAAVDSTAVRAAESTAVRPVESAVESTTVRTANSTAINAAESAAKNTPEIKPMDVSVLDNDAKYKKLFDNDLYLDDAEKRLLKCDIIHLRNKNLKQVVRLFENNFDEKVHEFDKEKIIYDFYYHERKRVILYNWDEKVKLIPSKLLQLNFNDREILDKKRAGLLNRSYWGVYLEFRKNYEGEDVPKEEMIEKVLLAETEKLLLAKKYKIFGLKM
jgi:hypothetical protein